MQKISSTQKVEVMRTVKVLSKLVITKLPDVPTWGLMVDNLALLKFQPRSLWFGAGIIFFYL